MINNVESDSDIAIESFEINKMIINSDKFQVIVLDKKTLKQIFTYTINQVIKSVSSVDLLGIQDYKLSFNLHINNICKSGVDQPIVLIILTQFPSFHAKKFLIPNVFLLMILMLRTKSYLQKEESAQ